MVAKQSYLFNNKEDDNQKEKYPKMEVKVLIIILKMKIKRMVTL